MASHPRQAWEHVDEILQTLKTTFPLLILSLETMVDQIQHKFKPTAEEDVYRHVSLLLSDAVQVCWVPVFARVMKLNVGLTDLRGQNESA
jgi:predicted glycosyltransferase